MAVESELITQLLRDLIHLHQEFTWEDLLWLDATTGTTETTGIEATDVHHPRTTSETTVRAVEAMIAHVQDRFHPGVIDGYDENGTVHFSPV